MMITRFFKFFDPAYYLKPLPGGFLVGGLARESEPATIPGTSHHRYCLPLLLPLLLPV